MTKRNGTSAYNSSQMLIETLAKEGPIEDAREVTIIDYQRDYSTVFGALVTTGIVFALPWVLAEPVMKFLIKTLIPK